MHGYLGKDYSSDSIKNFLLYWMKPCDPRSENDLDCLYYCGDLKADTLFSAWIPMKLTLESLNGGKFYKRNKYGDPNKFLKMIYSNQEKLLPSQNEAVIRLRQFLSKAEEKENYFLLPNQDLNNMRCKDCDWIPKFMHRLFTDNRYIDYFGDMDAVIAWIKNQKLDVCFIDRIVDEQHIDPIIPKNGTLEFSWELDYESILTMLERYSDILSQRKALIMGDDCTESEAQYANINC